MTAPTIAVAPTGRRPAVDEGEWPVRFPVMAVEDLDTSDGRYLSPGALLARAVPFSILALPFSSHGGQEPPPAVVVGRVDSVRRVAGPDVVSRHTGAPFPAGTFVWVGEGAVDPSIDVHGLNIGNLLRRRFLNGASVDLAGMDVEVIDEDLAAEQGTPRRQMVAHRGELAAITLVPIPAFADAYIELVDDDEPYALAAAADMPAGFSTVPAPAWRSVDVGDLPLMAAAEPAHTGGMVALVPAGADELTVTGGDSAADLHLTLAYLGDDVTSWDDRQRDAVLAAAAAWAEAQTSPVQAEVMGHAVFNPTGAHDRDPCAVYLVSGPGLPEAKTAFGNVDASDHPVFLPHITAGYGLAPADLSYVGPVVFDRVRVALGDQTVDFPLGEPTSVTAAGRPDRPQACEQSTCTAPAVRSLLFADRYLPVCEQHDHDGRAAIVAAGSVVDTAAAIPTVPAVPADITAGGPR